MFFTYFDKLKLSRFVGTVLVWTSYMTLNSLAVKSTKTVEGGSYIY